MYIDRLMPFLPLTFVLKICDLMMHTGSMVCSIQWLPEITKVNESTKSNRREGDDTSRPKPK